MRKRALNAGELPRLYYWRDNTKLEIDLIKEEKDGPHPIEIKSGRTYRNEWSRPMRRWITTTGISKENAQIIYGGDMALRNEGIEAVPWFHV